MTFPSLASPTALMMDDDLTLSLDRPITLSIPADSDAKTFTAQALQLTLKSGVEDSLQDCHLVLAITLAQYQQVVEQALFHLKPEVRGPLQRSDFVADSPLWLELGLQAQLLEHITPLVAAIRSGTAAAWIKDSSPKSDLAVTLADGLSTSLLSTSSWLCRSVQQQQATETVGFSTLWAYTHPEQTASVRDAGTETLDAITTFLQKTAAAVKSEVDQELPQLQQSLSQFSNELTAALEQVDWETVLAQQAATSPKRVSAIVQQFFDEDDWAYVQLADGVSLQLAFQGDAGRWTCLARSDDAAAQLVFYSVCPMTVSETKTNAIAELLMRANDGLIIGNFELDFETGEIRYKTSLDVEGDRLTPALMQSLVYANVHTFDQYLPAIIAVLDGQATPVDAIAAIEQPE
ncbi:MAG: YbjN domain-containing protein [Cyanobacteria bacterium P01_H01_bin.58]